MLIEFSVENFLSIKEFTTLSCLSTKTKSKYKEIDENNIFSYSNIKLLKSIAISGANASGKSNIIKAIIAMFQVITNSFKDENAINTISSSKFKLNIEIQDKPAFFQIITIHNNTQYRYGFEIHNNTVISEWLFIKKTKTEVKVFTRENDEFDISKKYFKKGKDIIHQKLITSNILLISAAKRFDEIMAVDFFDSISNIKIISGISDKIPNDITINLLKNSNLEQSIKEFIKKADLGIKNIEIEEVSIENLPDDIPEAHKKQLVDNKGIFITTQKSLYDNNGNEIGNIDFDLNIESEGTKKFFALSGPLIESLNTGNVLIIDEFDARLHPLLSKTILNLFNSKITNPKNAQLIFVTHDVSLLNAKTLRRDQIYFTDKSMNGSTELYSLQQIKGTRNDASFDKDYLKGKYGAVPYLSDLITLLEQDINE